MNTEKKKQIDIIQEKAEAAGLSLSEVFREAKVPYSTVQNWKQKEPTAFETVNKLNETIERLAAEKTTAE